MDRLKRALQKFKTTVKADHRYFALALLDILKIMVSLILMSSVNNLSL